MTFFVPLTNPADNPFKITDDEKTAFSAELARAPKDPFTVAEKVFGDHKSLTNKCLWASYYLPHDLKVLGYLDAAKQAGITEVLPTVEDAARRAWEIASRANDKVSVEAL